MEEFYYCLGKERKGEVKELTIRKEANGRTFLFQEVYDFTANS